MVTDYEACAEKEMNAAFAVSPASGNLKQSKTHLLNSVYAAMETAIMTLNPENGNEIFCVSLCRATLLAAESLLRNKKLFAV